MSESKHMPGPWSIHGQFDSEVSVEIMAGDLTEEALIFRGRGGTKRWLQLRKQKESHADYEAW
jgi:hypothetical protein